MSVVQRNRKDVAVPASSSPPRLITTIRTIDVPLTRGALEQLAWRFRYDVLRNPQDYTEELAAEIWWAPTDELLSKIPVHYCHTPWVAIAIVADYTERCLGREFGGSVPKRALKYMSGLGGPVLLRVRKAPHFVRFCAGVVGVEAPLVFEIAHYIPQELR